MSSSSGPADQAPAPAIVDAADPARRGPRRIPGWVPWLGLCIAVGLIVLAIAWPAATGENVRIRSFPPLHAKWIPRVGPGTIPALFIAGFSAAFAPRLAAQLRWRWVLLGAFVLGAAWLISLALVDGLGGIGHILDTQYEYLRTARAVTDFGATLHEYISRIPLDSPHNWPVHIAGHPPGALLFFYVLVHLGLGSGLAAGFVVTLVAATTPVAVFIALKRLGAEDAARRAAPFIVLGPAAIWMSVSADAMFGAFAAWGLCLLAFSATAASRRTTAAWGLGAGLLLGYCVMLSYGLPLLAVLALAVLLVARSWTPLPWAIVAALVPMLAFAVAGFAWWQAYPVLVDRYWDGIATRRPYEYWVWADLAALAISAGPMVGASVAVGVQRLRRLKSALTGERVVILLTVAAALTIALADISGMSKAEVERIWLPFVPWLLLGTALLPERWRRWGLLGQLLFALTVQHLLSTGW